ncbi:MAG: transglycosylase SLT domain-containing protein [Candidatus Latescibacterota bacterium]|nr:transglycosylase SLT domain-containing protein [Candidatus Latescibacterota bacterium]
MVSRILLVISTTALCVLVLLPLAAHFAREQPHLLETDRPSRSRDALGLIRNRQYVAAYDRLRTETQSDELNVRHELRLAICERALGMAHNAYARLARLPNQLPLLEDYRRLWMARALEQLGEREAAAGSYADLITAGEQAGNTFSAVLDSARLCLAGMHAEDGAFDAALRLYRRQIEGNSRWTPVLLFRIAEAEQHSGKTMAARVTRHRLMEDYPAHRLALDAAQMYRVHSAAGRHVRAGVFYQHGDYKRAISELRTFLRQHPGHEATADARNTLGRAYAKAGQYGQARRTFESLYEGHGHPSALFWLASLDVRDDRDLEAIDTYARFVRTYPRHSLADDALWSAAKAAERKDHFNRAAELYERLVSNYPGSNFAEDSAWSVGFTRYCQRDYDAALEIFRDVSRRAEQPHIVDQALFWAGKTARRLGLSDEARLLFIEAATGFPRSYYASRAVSLGYGSPLLPPRQQLRAQPTSALKRAESVQMAGLEFMQRAFALDDLGMTWAAEGELRRAERTNRQHISGLKLVRDGYEELGLHNRALRLSTRIATTNEVTEEVARLYPDYYWEEVERAAEQSDLDPHLILSVIRQESYFNEDAVSRAGAVGLMQIMPRTGRKLARSIGVSDYHRRLLFDPRVSIQLGSRFLGDQVNSFRNGPTRQVGFELGLAAYNAGPHVAKQWAERFSFDDVDAFVERIPYRETRLYVKKVLKNYAIYKSLSSSYSSSASTHVRSDA